MPVTRPVSRSYHAARPDSASTLELQVAHLAARTGSSARRPGRPSPSAPSANVWPNAGGWVVPPAALLAHVVRVFLADLCDRRTAAARPRRRPNGHTVLARDRVGIFRRGCSSRACFPLSVLILFQQAPASSRCPRVRAKHLAASSLLVEYVSVARIHTMQVVSSITIVAAEPSIEPGFRDGCRSPISTRSRSAASTVVEEPPGTTARRLRPATGPPRYFSS